MFAGSFIRMLFVHVNVVIEMIRWQFDDAMILFGFRLIHVIRKYENYNHVDASSWRAGCRL